VPIERAPKKFLSGTHRTYSNLLFTQYCLTVSKGLFAAWDSKQSTRRACLPRRDDAPLDQA